jgi:hypothetical protein
MKAIIATGLGVLALGGVLVANSGRSASAQPTSTVPAIVNQADSRTTLVNCGEGRQALITSDPRGTGLAQPLGPMVAAVQVQCVATDASAFATGVPTAMPVSQFSSSPFVPAVVSPVRPAVEQRVEYSEPAARPTYRSTSRSSSVRRTSAPVYRSAEPSYSRSSDVSAARQGRSWKKSAAIIGGSTAAGAGVGAILGGKSGAVKGGVVGLIGGTVYDVATRNRDTH